MSDSIHQLAAEHWAKPLIRASGGLPVHMFTVTSPDMIDGKRVHHDAKTLHVLVPGSYCDRNAAEALLKAALPHGYTVHPISDWRGDISCIDHQRKDLDNYADPHPGTGLQWAKPA